MRDLFTQVGGSAKFGYVCAREALRVLAVDVMKHYPGSTCYAALLQPAEFVVSPELNYVLIVRWRDNSIWAINPIKSSGNPPNGVEPMSIGIWHLGKGHELKEAVTDFAAKWQRDLCGTLDEVTGNPGREILTIVPRPAMGMRT